MKIAVFGASGLSGLPTVQLAAAKGLQVNALQRRPAAAPLPGVNYVLGSPDRAEDVRKALEGADVLAVCLGHNLKRNAKGGRTPFGKAETPADFMEKAASVYLPIAKELGVKRVIYFSAYGVGAAEYKHLPLIFRIIIRLSAIKHAYADHEAAEALIRASGLDYTILHPGYLTEADEVHAFTRDPAQNGGGISRKTVANFIVDTALHGGDSNASVALFGAKKG